MKITPKEIISVLIIVGLVFNVGFCCGRIYEQREFKKKMNVVLEGAIDVLIKRGYRLTKTKERQ